MSAKRVQRFSQRRGYNEHEQEPEQEEILMIYLDYNATTPLCDAAREAMLPYLNRYFGNPSSVHAAGREARAAIDDARNKVSALLHA